MPSRYKLAMARMMSGIQPTGSLHIGNFDPREGERSATAVSQHTLAVVRERIGIARRQGIPHGASA